MNFASKSLTYLLPAWLKKVEEECENEASEEHQYEIKVLEDQARTVVWRLCSLLGVNKRGVPGHACQLLERYIFHKMQSHCNFVRGSEEFENFSHSLESQLFLIVLTCVKLSAKMFISNLHLSMKVVCKCLRLNELQYTDKEIFAMEFNVLKLLNFTLPLWTGVDVARLLAYAIGLSEEFMEKVELIMNFAELRRDRINHDARVIAGLSLSPSKEYVNKTVRSLHLAAGAVLTLMQYQNLHDMEREKTLATITRAPYSYLKCLSLIIYKSQRTITITEDPLSRERVKEYN